MPVMNSSHLPYGNIACMPCAMNIMYAYFNIMNASFSSSCIKSEMSMINKHTKVKTTSSSKSERTKQVWVPNKSYSICVYRPLVKMEGSCRFSLVDV